MSNPSTYSNFLATLSRLARPVVRAPAGYNTHLIVPSPFHSGPKISIDPRLNLIRIKSEKYDAELAQAIALERQSLASGSSDAQKEQTQFLQKEIPLPSVIMRHIKQPVSHLANGTSLGKIVGFRIETKGRRGPRSRRISVSYGRLDLGQTGGSSASFVDFGKSHYVTKRGTTGVKAWVVYGNN